MWWCKISWFFVISFKKIRVKKDRKKVKKKKNIAPRYSKKNEGGGTDGQVLEG